MRISRATTELHVGKKSHESVFKLLPWCQVLSDGEERLQRPSLPQLDARFLRLTLLLPALQKPRAVQLPRVSTQVSKDFIMMFYIICI